MPTQGRPLRVVLCTSGGLYGAIMLRRLLDCERIRLCGIVHSTRILDARFGFLRGAREQVLRSGLAYSAYLLCATTLSDCFGGRATGGSVSRLASTRDIPRLETRDANNPAGCDFLRRIEPDLLVSAFFNQRLGDSVLSIARCGAVNIHPSLLPDFKGVDPVFHSWLNGGTRLGVTVHRMVPELDAGHILARCEVAPPTGASLFAATAELFRRGAQLLVEVLDKIERGDPGVAQVVGGNYDSWPTPKQVSSFRARGHALVSASDVFRLWWRRSLR